MSIENVSYSIGVIIAKNLQQQGFTDLDSKAFSDGFADLINNADLRISLAEANLLMKNYTAKQQETQFSGAKKEGEAFLLANGKKEGVITMPSGLQYRVLVKGEGRKPLANEKVTTHYHGTLLDGTVFDSSVQRGEPISFPVGGVIKGWQEALQMMNKGSKWQLFIPYNLAYGAQGAGAAIKPYATLIFEVELLDIGPA